MPTFTNPKFVHVEPRGFPVLAFVVLGVETYATYEIAQWLASIALIIVAVVAAVTVGSVTTLGIVLYRHRGTQHLDAPEWVTRRCSATFASHELLPDRPSPAIVASPQPVIAPAVHYHLHLHAAPAQPAIEQSK